MPPYRPPRWLPGGHLQTIVPAFGRPPTAFGRFRERWETPDDDFIDVDRCRPTQPAPDSPLLVLFHGLEGSAESPYARAAMAGACDLGWEAAVPNFRGCGGELNRAPRAYHSGDSEEIDWILRRFASEAITQGRPARPIFAVGVSLGGNALLKWLGERGNAADFVRAALAVCPPQDLQAGASALARGFSRIYARHFLSTLKQKSLGKLAQYPDLFDRERMLSARDFFDFDDAVTAPMHGFRSCYDYWTRSSCRQFLGGIRVPTRVLNALNDPFLPPSALARPEEVAACVSLDYPTHGGHVGFLASAAHGGAAWLTRYLLEFLDAHR